MSNSSDPSPSEATNPAQAPTTTDEIMKSGAFSVAPPLRFGALAGGAGALTGIGAAILKGASPIQSAIMTGTQWGVLGTTFWFSRQIIVSQMGGEHTMNPRSKLAASTISGVPTGAMLSYSVRGRFPMGSAILFCGGLAFCTQLAINQMPKNSIDGHEETDWSKWTPLKKLSDAEYIHTMEEKILRVDADIALIDDRITNLRAEQAAGGDDKIQVHRNVK